MRKDRKRLIYATFAGLTLAVAISVLAQNPTYQLDPNWKVPESAVAVQNPLAQRPETAKGGKKLFLRNCAECHGKDGAGLPKKHSADFRLSTVQGQPDGALFWKITNGNADRGMPSFKQTSRGAKMAVGALPANPQGSTN